MKINVTKRDIEQGTPGSPDSCPIALATRRVKPRSKISVGIVSLYINDREYGLPPISFNFVKNFDDRKKCKPFSFEINK